MGRFHHYVQNNEGRACKQVNLSPAIAAYQAWRKFQVMSTAFVCNRIERKALIGSVLRTQMASVIVVKWRKEQAQKGVFFCFFAFVFTFLIFPRKTSFRQRYAINTCIECYYGILSKLWNVGGNQKTLLIWWHFQGWEMHKVKQQKWLFL